MNKEEAMNKVKKHMEWVARNELMDSMRRADQCYGILMGAEIALNLDYGEDWDNFTEYWEDLRARILGYHR